MIRTALALMVIPFVANAGDIAVSDPLIPLAPPTAMAHAAYMTISNSGETPKQLIGIRAEGYAMAHIHNTEVTNDVATMSAVDLIEIAPGQSVVFETGGLHVMLMKPDRALSEGDEVGLTLEFSDGSTEVATATVVKRNHGHSSHGGHGSHSGHGS